MYNVAIIGAGPAGIFSALEIMKNRPDWKVLIVEKGSKIEKRKCIIRNGAKACPPCKKCGLLCGWGGAGAFSDGKLTLTFSNDGKGDKSTWPFNAAFYLKLNLAWGGDWGGAKGVDEKILPATYEVDYVRVYQK